MKLSTTSNIYYIRQDGGKKRFAQSIEKCAAAGFDCIDFMLHNAVLDKNNELCGNDWQRQIENIRDVLEENKITANQAHAPFYEYLDPDLPERRFKEEMTRRSVIAAGKLGVEWIVFHPGTLYGNPRMKDNMQANLEHIKPLLELAGQYDMGIAFENIFDKFMLQPGSRVKNDTEWNARFVDGGIRTARHFASWPEELAELADAAAAYGKTGVCWDTGHGNEMMIDQKVALEILGSRLKALHVNDNSGVHDEHLLPYFGLINWKELMITLKRIGYKGELTYETGKNFIRIPETLVDDALRYAVKIGRYLISIYDNA